MLRRFAFREGLHEVEGVSFDRMVDPEDETRLHQSDWVTDRVTRALKDAIVGGVDKAWSLVAANQCGDRAPKIPGQTRQRKQRPKSGKLSGRKSPQKRPI
jgi:hypothetical protein